jgi:outer membrane protein
MFPGGPYARPRFLVKGRLSLKHIISITDYLYSVPFLFAGWARRPPVNEGTAMNTRLRLTALVVLAPVSGGAAAQEGGASTARPLPALPPSPRVAAPRVAGDSVPADRPLHLDEAVRIALAHQPDVETARASLRSAQGALRVERSARRPQVTLSLSQQVTRPFDIVASSATQAAGGSGGGATPGTGSAAAGTTSSLGVTGSSSVQGSQLLYDFGRTSANVAAARSEVRAAESSLAETRAQVVLNVKTAFYTHLQNHRLRLVAERELLDQQSHLEEARSRYRAGVVAAGDVARALAAVAAAQTSLAEAQRGEEDARLALNTRMGVDPATSVTPAEEEEATPELQPEALVREALSARAEVRRAEAAVTAAEQRLRAEKKGNLPSLSGVAGVSTSNSTFSQNAQGQPFVGFSLTATPLDGGLTRGRVEQAQAGIESARASLRSVELDVSRQVLGAYLDLQSAQQQVLSTSVEIASAEESVRVATGRYRAGLGTLLDVTDAQATLNDARVRQVNARAQVAAAVANLLYQLGQPAETAARTPAPPSAPFTLPSPSP